VAPGSRGCSATLAATMLYFVRMEGTRGVGEEG
jgi:hypothetical protein